MVLYDVPTDSCNLEIMGYSFFAEEVSANEAFRRRELNTNSIVGGTKKTTKGEYVGLEFSVTTHVKINPNTPNMHNDIFKEIMKDPVWVVSPDLGESFLATVIITPERESPTYLKLTINIKEVVDGASKIPGENFSVPPSKKISVKKKKKTSTSSSKKSNKKNKSKKKTVTKKTKSKSKKNK